MQISKRGVKRMKLQGPKEECTYKGPRLQLEGTDRPTKGNDRSSPLQLSGTTVPTPLLFSRHFPLQTERPVPLPSFIFSLYARWRPTHPMIFSTSPWSPLLHVINFQKLSLYKERSIHVKGVGHFLFNRSELFYYFIS